MYEANVLESADTSAADYVWLPVRVEKPSKAYLHGRVLLYWKDCWRIGDTDG